MACPVGSMPYTIKAGDTFYLIARTFGISVDALMVANPGINPNRLHIGQVICVPTSPGPTPACPAGTRSYTVQAGDNFYALSIRFNTTVAAIQIANPTVNPNDLRIGQQICIPV